MDLSKKKHYTRFSELDLFYAIADKKKPLFINKKFIFLIKFNPNQEINF